MARFRKWWYGYQALAFVALIPIMSHYVITKGLPRGILLIVVPIYLVMAWSFYKEYKKSR